MGHWAARGWWMLHAYGHPNVYFLDGGLKKWQADGYSISTEEEKFDVKGGDFDYQLNEKAVTNLESI